jgi:hypothetical protein
LFVAFICGRGLLVASVTHGAAVGLGLEHRVVILKSQAVMLLESALAILELAFPRVLSIPFTIPHALARNTVGAVAAIAWFAAL